MSGPYCTVSDLYAYGLPRGTLPNPGRLVVADATANTLTLVDHGLADGDVVTFRSETGSLPGGLTAATDYYVRGATGNTFQVAATAGGAAIDLSSAGARVLVIARPNYDAAIAFGAALIDDMLPGHVVPLEAPYPPVIVMTNAELAIAKLGSYTGAGAKSLAEMSDAAMKRLASWAKGRPIRGTNAPSAERAAQKSVAASVPYADPRGWNRHGGL